MFTESLRSSRQSKVIGQSADLVKAVEYGRCFFDKSVPLDMVNPYKPAIYSTLVAVLVVRRFAGRLVVPLPGE
jgi:hypothetical protein